jgi:hypothetical protein
VNAVQIRVDAPCEEALFEWNYLVRMVPDGFATKATKWCSDFSAPAASTPVCWLQASAGHMIASPLLVCRCVCHPGWHVASLAALLLYPSHLT